MHNADPRPPKPPFTLRLAVRVTFFLGVPARGIRHHPPTGQGDVLFARVECARFAVSRHRGLRQGNSTVRILAWPNEFLPLDSSAMSCFGLGRRYNRFASVRMLTLRCAAVLLR